MNLDAARCHIISQAYPIVQATIRENTITIKRDCLLQARPNQHTRRNHITKLTHKSLSRLARTVTETEQPLSSILTLSYGPTFPSDGKQVKRQLNTFLSWLRSKGLTDYVWFLEFQRRGAPHFHVLCGWDYDRTLHDQIATRWATILARDMNLSDQEKKAIVRQHKRARTYEAIREKDGAARYAIKYACKLEQKLVPILFSNVGRFWGASRSIVSQISPGQIVDITEDELRQWLADRCQDTANWLHLPEIIFIRRPGKKHTKT